MEQSVLALVLTALHWWKVLASSACSGWLVVSNILVLVTQQSL